MFRHILVPVDHDPACESAARHAYDLTRSLGGRVTLLHILDSDTDRQRRAAQRWLEVLAVGARRPPNQIILGVPEHDVAHAIAQFATQHGADLIVLGVSGTGGLADQALGTLAVTLTRFSGLPVHLIDGLGGHDRLLAPGLPAAVVRSPAWLHKHRGDGRAER